jgi:hypothetical protein
MVGFKLVVLLSNRGSHLRGGAEVAANDVLPSQLSESRMPVAVRRKARGNMNGGRVDLVQQRSNPAAA